MRPDTWVGAISLGWRPDGTRIRRKVTGRTKTEVRDKLKKLQTETDAGLKTSASYTLATVSGGKPEGQGFAACFRTAAVG